MIKEIELLYSFTQANNSFQSPLSLQRKGQERNYISLYIHLYIYKCIYIYTYIYMENIVTVASKHGTFGTSMYK